MRKVFCLVLVVIATVSLVLPVGAMAERMPKPKPKTYAVPEVEWDLPYVPANSALRKFVVGDETPDFLKGSWIEELNSENFKTFELGLQDPQQEAMVLSEGTVFQLRPHWNRSGEFVAVFPTKDGCVEVSVILTNYYGPSPEAAEFVVDDLSDGTARTWVYVAEPVRVGFIDEPNGRSMLFWMDRYVYSMAGITSIVPLEIQW